MDVEVVGRVHGPLPEDDDRPPYPTPVGRGGPRPPCGLTPIEDPGPAGTGDSGAPQRMFPLARVRLPERVAGGAGAAWAPGVAVRGLHHHEESPHTPAKR
ncbi:MAG TPA: hypothetical protein VGD67_04810 [Pseudonocardiaceae bacterium]